MWNPKESGGFNEGSPQYSRCQVVQVGNSVYDVLYWFARGYRNVPLAANGTNPYKVTHVVTGADLVGFLRSHTQLMAQLYRLPLKRTRLVKRAITVRSDMNLGTAIQIVGKYNVDAAIILDEKKKVCGRFSANVVQELYWQWRLAESIKKGKMLVLADCKAAYRQGGTNPGLFNMNSIAADLRNGTNLNIFNCFSSLSHPLKLCEGLGVGMKTLQEHVLHQAMKKVGAAMGAPGAFNEEDEDSDSSASSSSSSGSSSNSDDSDSDNDRRKTKKAPPPKTKPAKGGGKRPEPGKKGAPPPKAQSVKTPKE